jgi:DNA mismatch repair protein MutS2
MHAGTLRALEFDRIVAIVAELAVTPMGRAAVEELSPMTSATRVASALGATSEGTRFLLVQHGFPLRAPAELEAALDGLATGGRALEPLRLLGLADFLESIELSRRSVTQAGTSLPFLLRLVEGIASFRNEIADVRRKIEPSGEVADNASPALAAIRDRLRKQRGKLRSTLESFLRERETSKYLQEQVVTDRNGRYVLMVRAEHRGAIPGVVHGASASGASLFLEPLATVDVNNEIVELEEREAEEVRRILLALTDAFRARPDDLQRTIGVATELDVVQAKARFSQMTAGIEPSLSSDGALELVGARHPLLLLRGRETADARDTRPQLGGDHESVIPVDVMLRPPTRVLIIAGPNTGGKTVALKTAGLFAAMAQAGLHVPAEKGSRLPVFRAIFADIGDEQSIAASLSTFSAHIANLVAMDRNLELPALVLLDEVGAGTDPVEGGALGTAVIDHFRKRGAHVVATTHYDALKTYAATTEGVTSAAFGFDPATFAPTYGLTYGSPGRSLAIEIAARLGMAPTVISAARGNVSDREAQLAAHLQRVDAELRTLEQERKGIVQLRLELAEGERRLRNREASLREKEEAFKRRVAAKVDERLRDARKEIDAVIDGLKARATVLREKGERRGTARLSTGETGMARSEAHAALDALGARLKDSEARGTASVHATEPQLELAPGVRVSVGTLGLEGTLLEIHGRQADVDVRGKRLRAAVNELRVVGKAPAARASVSVDLQPRSGSLTELNVIGCTVDEALTRAGRFLDETMLTDVREIRVVHGHGTGQLRRALTEFFKAHPLVAHFEHPKLEHGGGGVTVVELKE